MKALVDARMRGHVQHTALTQTTLANAQALPRTRVILQDPEAVRIQLPVEVSVNRTPKIAGVIHQDQMVPMFQLHAEKMNTMVQAGHAQLFQTPRQQHPV